MFLLFSLCDNRSLFPPPLSGSLSALLLTHCCPILPLAWPAVFYPCLTPHSWGGGGGWVTHHFCWWCTFSGTLGNPGGWEKERVRGDGGEAWKMVEWKQWPHSNPPQFWNTHIHRTVSGILIDVRLMLDRQWIQTKQCVSACQSHSCNVIPQASNWEFTSNLELRFLDELFMGPAIFAVNWVETWSKMDAL